MCVSHLNTHTVIHTLTHYTHTHTHTRRLKQQVDDALVSLKELLRAQAQRKADGGRSVC